MTEALKALSGIRVIDAATLVAAPFAATLMAEFGAEVIKVEDPGRGDSLREWGPQKNGAGLMWKSVSRNKKSITLNLRAAEGQTLLRRLVKDADVLMVNMRPGTLERWGMGYDLLREVNPNLVMLHVTGFGLTGPYADRPGFGTLAEAMSGFAHTTGQPGGPPTLPPFMLADSVASLTATFAVMFALYHRDVHGAKGQLIDVGLMEPLMRLLELMFIDYDQNGNLWGRVGNQWKVTVPRNTYQSRDGQWLAMSGSASSVIPRLFRAIGRADLCDHSEYADPQGRLAHADEIDAIVASWVASRDLDDALSILQDHAVPAAPVYDAARARVDPQVIEREVFARFEDRDLGTMELQNPAPRMSETPGRIEHLGPALGEHNPEIYGGLLGLSVAECHALKSRGVI